MRFGRRIGRFFTSRTRGRDRGSRPVNRSDPRHQRFLRQPRRNLLRDLRRRGAERHLADCAVRHRNVNCIHKFVSAFDRRVRNRRCAPAPEEAPTLADASEHGQGSPANWHCPNFKVSGFRRAELQLGRLGYAKLRASAPEASGVKTPDQTTLFVGSEVPTSYGTSPRQRLSN